MGARETIKTWQWRIKKTGKNQGEFARLVGISPSLLSDYCNGKKSPSLERFDLIENTLKFMGV